MSKQSTKWCSQHIYIDIRKCVCVCVPPRACDYLRRPLINYIDLLNLIQIHLLNVFEIFLNGFT